MNMKEFEEVAEALLGVGVSKLGRMIEGREPDETPDTAVKLLVSSSAVLPFDPTALVLYTALRTYEELAHEDRRAFLDAARRKVFSSLVTDDWTTNGEARNVRANEAVSI